MPVCSYVAHPVPGAKEALIKDLTAIKYCEVIVAENQEILILVTDTPNEKKEKDLHEKLKELMSLQSLGMIFGHTDD